MTNSYLVGLGFDCQDGHLRITKGKNFRIYGGSDKTHQIMQEKVIKFNEKLDKKGKSLDEISTKEFTDIAHSIGFKLQNKKRPRKNNRRIEGGI